MKTVLEERGFKVNVAWGHARGVDIDARSDAEHLYIEAKGDAPTPQMQGNYFLGALGELLQRMSDPRRSTDSLYLTTTDTEGSCAVFLISLWIACICIRSS